MLTGVRIKYSAVHFRKNYEKLAPEVQRRFFFVDAELCKGNLHVLRQQGWMYFVNLDAEHAAFGSLKDDGKVFLWRFIGSKRELPVIL
jgi:hypothetical protein